jgi:hypothetical protein
MLRCGMAVASVCTVHGTECKEIAVNRTIYCLVDVLGRVYAKYGAASYAEVAAEFDIDPCLCRWVRFDLTTRRRIIDHDGPDGTTPSWRCAA